MWISRKRFDDEIRKAVIDAEDRIHMERRLEDVELVLSRRIRELENRVNALEHPVKPKTMEEQINDAFSKN